MVKIESFTLATTGILYCILDGVLAQNTPVNRPADLRGPNLPVTGVKAVDGASWTKSRDVPLRLEIRDFVKNQNQLTLFMLAMQRLQNPAATDPRTDKLSYYRLGAIHGAPAGMYWGTTAPPQRSGYCQHRNTAFPVWHRPYVAIVEQAVSLKAMEIAQQFDGGSSGQWNDAAKALRMPYWDWALPLGTGEAPIPDVLTQQQFTYSDPSKNGQQTSIPNPMFQYTFPGAYPNMPANMTSVDWEPYYINLPRAKTLHKAKTTNRGPNTMATLQKSNNGFTQDVYNILNVPNQSWEDFSTIAIGRSSAENNQSLTKYMSIEAVHNSVHASFGSGHMGSVPTAAFDPIFWPHHANVDRLFALWQRQNPNTWINDRDANMAPFFSTSDQMWTPASSRNHKAFGYDYPEMRSEEAFQATMSKYRVAVPAGIIQGALNGNSQGPSTTAAGNGTATSDGSNASPSASAGAGGSSGDGSSTATTDGSSGDGAAGNTATDGSNGDGSSSGATDGSAGGNTDGVTDGSGSNAGDSGSDNSGAAASDSDGSSNASGGSSHGSSDGASKKFRNRFRRTTQAWPSRKSRSLTRRQDGGDDTGSGDGASTPTDGSSGDGSSAGNTDGSSGSSDGAAGNTPTDGSNGNGSSTGNGAPTSMGDGAAPTGSSGNTLSTPPTSDEIKSSLGKILTGQNTYTEYVCNIQIPSTAFDKTTNFHLFLGSNSPDASSSPDSWDRASSFAGYFGFWTGDTSKMNMGGNTIGGSVSLTNALMKLVIDPNSGLKDMQPNTVAAYLKSNMNVRISQASTNVDPKSVTGLSMDVSGTPVTLDPAGQSAAQYGQSQNVYQVSL